MKPFADRVRCLSLLAMALVALLCPGTPAMAQQSNCCFANGTPGCDNAQCQQQVCAQDPFCCNSSWDGLCANLANQICAVCQQCGPACGKANVECLSGAEYNNRRPVGRFLPVGCTAFLIAEPNVVITNAHCNLGSPGTWSVQFNFECSSCTNGTPKPTQSFSVQQVLLVDNTRDIMIMRLNGNPAATYGIVTLDPSVVVVGTPIYEIHHAAGQPKGFDDGVVTGTFLNVNCPGNILEHSVSVIASQGASGSPVFRQDNHAVTAICNCGPPCSQGFVLPMSTLFPFIQTNANQNGYQLSVVGQQACGTAGTGSCCVSNGTPFCDNADCCSAICAVDPFCCSTAWDQICADQAFDECVQCFECGSAGAGDCCTANGTPYCNNASCCAAVCAADPFCCSTAWDGLCAQGAADLCAICAPPSGACCLPGFACDVRTQAECAGAGGVYQGNNTTCFPGLCPSGCGDPGSGSCCVANGTPYCDNEVCCELICAVDSFCCSTAWDGLCASQAIDQCQQCFQCGSGESGSCCVANGTPYCNDAACCQTVCGFDPFCCNTLWDGICANGAASSCGTLCGSGCIADLNNDGVVDADDLGILLGDFGCVGSCVADLDNSGSVDADDLGILLGDFGCGS